MPYVVFALLAAASWNRWIEPYVDTGRELMVPWRVAQGERLYRDVHFHHGPLGPWLGAASDRLAGRSLAARTALAAAIALLALVALDRLGRRFLSPGRAALATSLAVAAAFFQRPGGWMFPFSFDCAIAVAAMMGAVVLLLADRARWDGAAGFCLLAATLARVEMGLAGIAIVALHVLARREPLRLLRLAFFPVAASAAVYGAVSFGIPRDRLVADGWLRVLDPPEAFRNVYRAYAGLDRPGLRAAELALCVCVLALAAAFVFFVAAAASRLGRGVTGSAAEASVWTVLALAAAVSLWPPASMAAMVSLLPPLVRAIPPVIVAAAAGRLALLPLRRAPAGVLSPVPDAVLWLGGLFAARILFAAGYGGPYGSFFLPLPVLVCVAGLFGLADRLAPAIGPALPRLTAAALTVFLLARCAATIQFYRGQPWGPIATPAGSVRLPEPVAGATREALADLSTRVPGGGTLAGFPEAGFFAYALGLRGPFATEQFFPGHLDAAGEERAIALLRSRPPEVLLYANVLAVGEGQRAFGTDYLRRLDAEARADFATVAIYGPGARPGARIGDPDFFVELRRPVLTESSKP
ncbi:MAG TPA: hypothetical protein VGK26_05520 [Thermoanaerobaculia bacterium]